MEEFKLLKELSEGFSNQAKLSNKYWLFLMLASIVSISHLKEINKFEKIDLPFKLGNVNFIDFNSFILLMICVSSIAYASAFLQTHRTRKLIQKLIDNTHNEKKFIYRIHIQDIFDSIVTPTFNRVAPIAQFLQGSNQFFGEKKPNKMKRFIGAFVYIILKFTTIIIIYIVPFYALIQNFKLFINLHNDTSWGLPYFFYWIISLISISMFGIMLISDFAYIFKVLKRISKK